MFSKKNNNENRCIIAVKKYDETMKSLKDGTISLPYNKATYSKLLDSQTIKVDNLKELKKFIRANSKTANEVSHYWEGLIVQGYTLVNVEYLDKTPPIDHLCGNDTIKFVCAI